MQIPVLVERHVADTYLVALGLEVEERNVPARYRAGVGNQFEVVAAETTLREAEFNYAQAVYDYLVTASRLGVATGQVPLADRMAGVEGASDG